MKNGLIIFCCIAMASCANLPVPPAPDQEVLDEVDQATLLIDEDWPATRTMLATTDGDIYLGNLNSQISVIQSNPGLQQQVAFKMTLAGLLYQRFQIEGRLEDAEQARGIMDTAQSDPRFRAADHLVYAKVLAGFHDFEAANRQIEQAKSMGAPESSTNSARQAIEQSLHLPAEGVNEVEVAPADYIDAVQASARLLNQGKLVKASETLQLAQDLYRDSSPFPLAWIYIQQGIVFLRHGEYEQARVFFAAAHDRFPQYFLATEHLAETEGLLGNHERSARLYRIVIAQNNQPAFWHGLAQAEFELGNTAAAEEASRNAELGYQDLITRHPLMYADHAVGYYIDTDNPVRALELAQLNFSQRKDLSAHLALAEALMGNGLGDEACTRVGAIRNAGLAPPEITLAHETLTSCIAGH